MKKTLLITSLFLFSMAFSFAQCNLVSSSISSSSTTMVQMYTPASFFILPSASNTYFWQLFGMNGMLLDSNTTTSNFQILNFSVPLTDSLVVCQTVRNSSTGSVCSLCDTMTYQGAIIEWGLITTNIGDTSTTTSGGTGGGTVSLSEETRLKGSVFPNPTTDRIFIKLENTMNYTATIRGLNGQLLMTTRNTSVLEISTLPNGIYLLEIKDEDSNKKLIKKIIKL